MSKQSDLVTVARDAGASGYVNVAGDTMTGALNLNGGARVPNTDIFFDRTGYDSWKQTNFLGNMYLNNGVDRFIIDSAGRVTMPYQPAFSVRGTYSGSIGGGAKFTFTSDLGGQSPEANFDRTGSWSNANSRYTAPVTGVYQFNFSIYTQGVQSTIQSLAPRVNGAQLLTGDNLIFFRSATGETGNTDDQVSGSFTLKLNVNDYVEIFVRTGAPTITTYGGHSNFSGFLIG